MIVMTIAPTPPPTTGSPSPRRSSMFALRSVASRMMLWHCISDANGRLFVMFEPIENLSDVDHRLDAARESILHDGIVIDGSFRFTDEPVRDVIPRAGIVAVLVGQSLCIFDVAEADVVRAENEFDALLFARNRVLQFMIELPQ